MAAAACWRWAAWWWWWWWGWWWCGGNWNGGGGKLAKAADTKVAEVGVLGCCEPPPPPVGIPGPPPAWGLPSLLTVLFRFQQSGCNFFCSSAINLALCEYCSRSSCGRDFQASPSNTLMALQTTKKIEFYKRTCSFSKEQDGKAVITCS